MRGSQEISKSGISAASVVQWPVYIRSAGISRRSWRRITAIGSVYRSVMKGWQILSSSSFHVCSPDIAISDTRYVHSGVFSTMRSSMSSQTTKARRRLSSNRWCRLNQYQSLRVWKKRRRTGTTYHTSMTFTQNHTDQQSSFHYLDPGLSGLPWLPSKLFADASSATDSRSSYVTYTST